jgi:hypothetical protein
VEAVGLRCPLSRLTNIMLGTAFKAKKSEHLG